MGRVDVPSLHPVRVLGVCSLGGAGHLRPLSALLAAAVELGHDVAVVAPPNMREMVAEAGFEWIGGGEPPEDEIGPIRELLPVLPAAEASELGERELFGRIATAAMLPALRPVCATWRPDLILRDPCEHAATVVAVELDLPVAQVAISVAAGEWRAIDRSAPSVATFAPLAPARNRSMPYVSRFPAALDPSPFPTTLRYHVPTRPPAGRLPDWWHGSTAPLVYVSFGTVLGFMSIAADVFRVAVDAVADLDARVLLTVGRTFDLSALGPVPEHVHVEPWVDHETAVAEAALVLSHGGSGTVYATLAAGVPMVNVPVFADQFTNAEVVAAAGAGLAVVRPAPANGRRDIVGRDQVGAIRDAVRRVLADATFAERAAVIGREMAATPTAADVLATLLATRARRRPDRS